MAEETQTSVVKVVEITQDNFESQFALIKQSIDESAFVAFDMEFSGLERSGVSKAIQVDTVGVSIFEWMIVWNSLQQSESVVGRT